MASLADRIEAYLKQLLAAASEGAIEVRRCDLAEYFSCVPSQINYVLETRFTLEQGYAVESRRGGGGYIRIRRLQRSELPSLGAVYRRIGRQIGATEAERLLAELHAAGLLPERQVGAIRAALEQETGWLDPPLRDMARALLLKGMLLVTLHRS